MKDHEIYLNILDVTVLVLGLKMVREKAATDSGIEEMEEICDFIADKLDRQVSGWSDPAEDELAFMASVQAILDDIEESRRCRA